MKDVRILSRLATWHANMGMARRSQKNLRKQRTHKHVRHLVKKLLTASEISDSEAFPSFSISQQEWDSLAQLHEAVNTRSTKRKSRRWDCFPLGVYNSKYKQLPVIVQFGDTLYGLFYVPGYDEFDLIALGFTEIARLYIQKTICSVKAP